MKKSAPLLALLLAAGIAVVYSEFLNNVNAQNKGRITGEVYVREDEQGDSTLLVAVKSGCGNKKDEPCNARPFDKIEIGVKKNKDSRISENVLSAEFFMRVFSGEIDLDGPVEYHFETAWERIKQLSEIRSKRPLTSEEYFESVRLAGFQVPAPVPRKLPMQAHLNFLDDFGKPKISFGYDEKDFDVPLENLLKIKVWTNIKFSKSAYEKYIGNELRLTASYKGKTVFNKKIKPVQLPKLDIKKIEIKQSGLPNTLEPGRPAYSGFDMNSPKSWTQHTKSGVKLFESPLDDDPFYMRLWISPPDGSKLAEKMIIGMKPIPKNGEEKNGDGKDGSDKIVLPPITDMDDNRIPFVLFPPAEANRGDKVGAAIYNSFGEKVADIEFPDVKLCKPIGPDDGVGVRDEDDKGSGEFTKEERQMQNEIEGLEPWERTTCEPVTKQAIEDLLEDKKNKSDEGGASSCSAADFNAPQFVLQERRLCVCGCFFNGNRDWDSLFTNFFLDGNPIVPQAASPSTIGFQIPADLSPGMHEITYKNPDGKAKSFEFRVLAVKGTIDQDRLWTGQGTTMTLEVLGTDKPMPLLLENKTPAIIGLSGGDRQIVNTSGGANNQVERQVLGMSRGNFIIDYSLDQPPCPCFRN